MHLIFRRHVSLSKTMYFLSLGGVSVSEIVIYNLVLGVVSVSGM